MTIKTFLLIVALLLSGCSDSIPPLPQLPADATILETLRAHGHELPSSCESGTCGTCRTTLVSGEVDHRDMVLEDHQRDSHIMICVSRARGGELVLRW